jgi:hypothetical protein
MLTSGQASANLVPDANLAALALEDGCELYSSDSDLSCFPRLKWKNPLAIRIGFPHVCEAMRGNYTELGF